jgi:multidrug resistance efflux pump
MNPRPIVQIVVTEKVTARFKVPERELRQVEVGKDVRVRVEAHPGVVFEGKIARRKLRGEFEVFQDSPEGSESGLTVRPKSDPCRARA